MSLLLSLFFDKNIANEEKNEENEIKNAAESMV